ncbi:MAG: hypothetical protein LBR11_10345 [Deltaproteobacteria bacterium]|jgi:tetratricopeptide (TPR) repeat protein|nr:hypothetical protein [Deltaproteobacteria bacterium]
MTAIAKSSPVEMMEKFDQLLDQSLTIYLNEDQDPQLALKTLEQAKIQYKIMFQIDDLSADSVVMRARCLSRLMDAYGTMGQTSQARQMLKELSSLPFLTEVRLEATRGTLNLVTDYALAGDLMEAQSMNYSTGRAGQDEGVALERGRAILSMAALQAKNGNLEAARGWRARLGAAPKMAEELRPFIFYYAAAFIKAVAAKPTKATLAEATAMYEAIFTQPQSDQAEPLDPDELFLMFKVRLNLVATLAEAGSLSQAIDIFDADWTEADERISTLRAETAVTLIKKYLGKKNIAAARAMYDRLIGLGESEEIIILQAQAATTLIEFFLQIGIEPAALKLYEELALWPNPQVAVPARAWAALPLIQFYATTGRLTEAHKIILELLNHLGQPDFPLEQLNSESPVAQLIVALGTLAVHYLQGVMARNNFTEAKLFYHSLKTLGSSRLAQEARAMAASLMVANYTMKDKIGEAIEIFRSIPQSGVSEAIREAKILSSDILTHSYAMMIADDHKHRKIKTNSRLAATWKGLILRWLGEILKDFKKAQGANNMPSLWS